MRSLDEVLRILRREIKHINGIELGFARQIGEFNLLPYVQSVVEVKSEELFWIKDISRTTWRLTVVYQPYEGARLSSPREGPVTLTIYRAEGTNKEEASEEVRIDFEGTHWKYET